jgi:1-phosphofructokinase family hexose kinase
MRWLIHAARGRQGWTINSKRRPGVPKMILCITPNPAIDRTLVLSTLNLGNVHRAQKVIVAAGGKGLNVARAIRTLGGASLCMGFAGGHSGRLLTDLAKSEGLPASWTWVNAETRNCTILVTQTGDATVINEPGRSVSSADWKRLQQDVQAQLHSTGLVCLSGSLPPNSSVEDLQGLLTVLSHSGKQVWVDTSGIALSTALAYPDISIKVNGGEIGAALGLEVKDVASAKHALLILSERGLRTAVITVGSSGALLVTKEGRWLAQGPLVDVVSTVGSGDSFLGGLVSALDAGKDWRAALRDAVAAGTANALSAGGGQFGLQEFEAIREQTQIQSW